MTSSGSRSSVVLTWFACSMLPRHCLCGEVIFSAVLNLFLGTLLPSYIVVCWGSFSMQRFAWPINSVNTDDAYKGQFSKPLLRFAVLDFVNRGDSSLEHMISSGSRSSVVLTWFACSMLPRHCLCGEVIFSAVLNLFLGTLLPPYIILCNGSFF
jgi:hypothetical protein